MKKIIITLSAISLFTCSCGQIAKKQSASTGNAINQNNGFPIRYDQLPIFLQIVENSSSGFYFTTPVRPNVKLQFGETYSDTFEYFDYDDEGDDFSIDAKKNGKIFPLIDNEFNDKNYARGDLCQIEWKIDTMRPAGDETQLWIQYYANKITKIKDGAVSVFRKKYTKPLRYTYSEENYTSHTLDDIYRMVEYYLANSKQENVKHFINDPYAELTYSIEERKWDGQTYIVIGIGNESVNEEGIATKFTFQWLYISDCIIYEYDLPNDKLVKFE